MISFEEFSKLELKIGTILEAGDEQVLLTVSKEVSPGTRIR